MEITKTEVFGFNPAFRGMRNPMDSWHLSDSMKNERVATVQADSKIFGCLIAIEDMAKHKYVKEIIKDANIEAFGIGDNDLRLAQSLIVAGGEHCKFLRMIHVWSDWNMPRYWWSEADTYHFNTKNSCSTMHKLFNKQGSITLDMFEFWEEDKDIIEIVIDRLNSLRDEWLITKDNKIKDRLLIRAKKILCESFNQKRTVDTTYAELRNMYFQRKPHRLVDEWCNVFCGWVESLPYSKELITHTKGMGKLNYEQRT